MLARIRKVFLGLMAAVFLTSFSTATAGTTHPPSSKAPTHLTSTKYTNWAGYQMRVATPTSARAVWKVPAASWQGQNGYSNQWVGLGGGTTAQGQLIQAGTESDNTCVVMSKGTCLKSRSTYSLWLETYPQRAQERITNLPVAAGETIDVQVDYQAAGNQAQFTLCNVTKKACVTATRDAPAPRAVAEFVVERPSAANGHPLALARFRTASFQNIQVADHHQRQSLRPLPTTRMQMDNGKPLAVTNDFDVTTGKFSVAYRRPC